MSMEAVLRSEGDETATGLHVQILGGTAAVLLGSDPFRGRVSAFLRSREDRSARLQGGSYRFAVEIDAGDLLRGRITPVADRLLFEPTEPHASGVPELILDDLHHPGAFARRTFFDAITAACAMQRLSPGDITIVTDTYSERALLELGRLVSYYADRLLDDSVSLDFLRSDMTRIDTCESHLRQVAPHASFGFGYGIVTPGDRLVKFGRPSSASATGVLAGAILPAAFALEVTGRRLGLSDNNFLAPDLRWTHRYGRLSLLRLCGERTHVFDMRDPGLWRAFAPESHLFVGEMS